MCAFLKQSFINEEMLKKVHPKYQNVACARGFYLKNTASAKKPMFNLPIFFAAVCILPFFS
jgi:hypothetical protein